MIWTVIFVSLVILLLYQMINGFIRYMRVGRYNEKHVFITGCDSGFGRLLVIRLDGLGFQIYAACYTENGRKSLEKTCSKNVTTLSLDVTQDDSIRQALTFVKKSLPTGKGLYALVNNAGVFGNMVTPEMLTTEDYKETLDVNFFGPIEVIRHFLPLIRKEKGRIVNMASIMGRFALTVAPYCASKNALEAYLDVLRKEVYSQGIRVSILQPGGYATSILDGIEQKMQRSYDNSSQEVKDAYGSHIEIRRIMIAEARFSGKLDMVVDAYEHALTAVFPHERYVIGWDSKLLWVPLSFLPEWLSDAIILVFQEVGIRGWIPKWL